MVHFTFQNSNAFVQLKSALIDPREFQSVIDGLDVFKEDPLAVKPGMCGVEFTEHRYEDIFNGAFTSGSQPMLEMSFTTLHALTAS